MKSRKRIDWVKAKLDYVNNPALQYEDIAAKYGVRSGTVRQRSNRESWAEARAARSNVLSQTVTRKSLNANAIELAKWNEDDVKVARALRNAAARKLQEAQRASEGLDEHGKPKEFPLKPGEIRSLGMAFHCAQQIARLALGASTTNIGDQTIEPLVSGINFEDLSDEQLIAFQQSYAGLLSATFGGNGQHTEAQGGAQVQ